MSISINVSGMNFNRLSYAERADIDKRKKIRLSLVRKQSKDFAKNVRDKFQTEKDIQLKRIQEIKRKELENLKRLQCEKIHEEYAKSLNHFGDAHIAAINASCEENDDDIQRKKEYDLMAAQRGRTSMQQEQRRRDREAEDRLTKRKRMNQKSVSIQADLVTRTEFRRRREQESSASDYEDESSDKYVSKVNKLKSSSYNPKNFTSNSVDSSNHGESIVDDDTTTPEIEDDSEDEFDQIQTLLKQRCFEFDKQIDRESRKNDEPVTISNSSSESEPELPPRKSVQKPITIRPQFSPKKQSILRKNGKSPKNPAVKDKRVNYDLGCKSAGKKNTKTGYSPKKQMIPTTKKTAEMMRHMEDKKSEEALDKETTRQDYENLREELDELAKQEQEAREAANKAFKNFSRVQLQQKEKVRRDKMNQAVENAMRRNILTCPPVDSNDKAAKKKILNLNVANPTTSSLGSEASLDLKSKPKPSSGELTNLIKMERLKDLLDRINHQKKLLLREIEKSDDIPGPDLHNVLEKIKILEKEKETLDAQSNANKISDEQKIKEIKELQEREKKIREREQRLESRLKELFKQTQKKRAEHSSSTVTDDASENISLAPVEIIIKVPSGKKKVKKSIRCVDTLHREPGRVYPKTPRKTKVSSSEDEKIEKLNRKEELKKVEQQTQTSPAVSVTGIPKSILKKSPDIASIRSEDSEVSTTYQSLPDRVNLDISTPQTNSRKSHHKLNPVLMHYITRLLGMKPNFQNQLNVQTSPVATPGSSTINTSGNNETHSDVPSFDEKRLKKLREFITENYSFLSEVNDTLERSKVGEENEENIHTVEGIWQDILRKKKPMSLDQNLELEKQKKIIEAQISQQMSRPLPQKPKQVEKRPKTAVAGKRTPHTIPANQSQSRPATSHIQGQSQVATEDMLSMTKILESHMMNNFSEYTASCQKRISELAQMMEKVRHEKLKLIEHSLSSGEFNHFTEYKDIILNQKQQDNPTTSASDLKDSSSQREDPASEEINNILHKQMKLFGISKDSGISLLSRPVTSSDFRDSPDVRVTSEEPDNSFQPILKDIPKPVKSKASSNDPQNTQHHLAIDASKKGKPPLSITRISPLLDKPHEAHELSTIAEVETPTASRVNIQIQDDERLKTFMNFEEYQRHLQRDYSNHPDQNLDEIMSKLEDLKLKTFIGPQAYGIDEISNPSRSGISSNASIDILDEMRKRNLYTKHIEEVTPPASNEHLNDPPASPRRPPAQSKIVLRTPDDMEISIELNTTPVNHAHARTKPPQHFSNKPADTISGVNEINDQRSESSGDELKIDIETSSSDGRPLNLAQFLAQELVKRSNKTASDESSLSSQFMRSLLNAASARSTPSFSSNSNDEKVRTSTPVQTKTNSSHYASTHKTSGQVLFQGDSVSTLKGSEGEKSGSSADDKSNA